MSIIKQITIDLHRYKLEEKAAAGDNLAEAELTALDLGIVEEAVKYSKQQKLDMNKLWEDYEGRNISKAELTEMIGNDLEMLEYNPKEIEQMLKVLVVLLHEKRLKAKPFLEVD